MLARGGHFDLLPQVISKVAIPAAVYQEVVVEGKGRPGSKEVKKYLDDLVAGGFYISSEAYEEILVRVGEEDSSS